MNAGRSKDSHVVEDYNDQAVEYILKALRIDKDDGGDKEQAVQWYKKGIAELERGIAVELTGQEDRYDQTKRLQDSMICHLTMARDKLSLLELTLVSERRSNPPSSSNHVLPQPKPVPTSQPATRGVSTNIRPSRPPLRPTHTKVIPRPAAVKQPSKRDLKNLFLSLIVDSGESVSFEDIAGQTLAKEELNHVIYPAIRPDLCDDLKRDPARGLLLFGPNGNGKTMLAKAVAAQSNITFFNISYTDLTSKYEGENKKLVQALFAVARELKPSVIFIDHIDCLLYKRLEGENPVFRKLRADFLIEFDKVRKDDRVVVIAATDRPWDLDEAGLKLFTRRVYVGMPDAETRFTLLKNLLKKERNQLSETELSTLAKLTEGYSGRELRNLADVATGADTDEYSDEQILTMTWRDRRKINMKDFEDSINRAWPTVDQATLNVYTKWIEQYGVTTTVDQLQTERLCRQQEQTSPLKEMENSRAELDEQEHRNESLEAELSKVMQGLEKLFRKLF